MKRFFQKFGKKNDPEAVTVVSGLPRSGTSMLMKMLEASGISPLTDNIRTADEDNPRGYYEFERVKKLPDGDIAWVKDAKGKSVKVIAALLEHLPPGYTYKVIFMHRNMDEILSSQKQMLIRTGKPTDKVSDEELARLFRKHLIKIKTWIHQQPNISVLDVDYNALLSDPGEYPERINEFLGKDLDTDKMLEVVDPSLYRQRR